MYDSLAESLKRLKVSSNQVGQSIRKATESNKLDPSKVIDAISADQATDLLCKLIYSQFNALRNDYLGNQINTARYTASLKILKEWLDENPGINDPALNRAEIMLECNTYVPGSYLDTGIDGSGKITPLV